MRHLDVQSGHSSNDFVLRCCGSWLASRYCRFRGRVCGLPELHAISCYLTCSFANHRLPIFRFTNPVELPLAATVTFLAHTLRFPPDVFIFAFYGGCVSCALFRGVLWLWLHYRPLWQTGAHDSGQKHGRLAVDGFCPLQAAPGPWLTAFPVSPTLHLPSLQEGQPDPCGA